MIRYSCKRYHIQHSYIFFRKHAPMAGSRSLDGGMVESRISEED